MSEILLTGNKH